MDTIMTISNPNQLLSISPICFRDVECLHKSWKSLKNIIIKAMDYLNIKEGTSTEVSTKTPSQKIFKTRPPYSHPQMSRPLSIDTSLPLYFSRKVMFDTKFRLYAHFLETKKWFKAAIQLFQNYHHFQLGNFDLTQFFSAVIWRYKSIAIRGCMGARKVARKNPDVIKCEKEAIKI